MKNSFEPLSPNELKTRKEVGRITVSSGNVAIIDIGAMASWSAARAAKSAKNRRNFGQLALKEFVGIVHGKLPKGEFSIFGRKFPKGRYAQLWECIDLDFGAKGAAAKAERIGEVIVERSRLLIADLAPLELWTEGGSLDGLADIVFWGRDAERLAANTDAKLEHERYWIRDLPVGKAAQLEKDLIRKAQELELIVVGEMREHDHHSLLLEQIDRSNGSGTILIEKSKIFGISFLNGDGAYPVLRELDSHGEILRLRILLGTAQTLQNFDLVNR